MKFKKIAYISLSLGILFTGCTDSKKGDESIQEEVKKVVVQKEEVKEVVAPKIEKKQMSVSEKKQRFKDILVPISTEVYNDLETQYERIKLDIANNTNRSEIEKLKKEYKAKTDEILLHALKPHPISILLAQAAAESAWLTSRFSTEANNIFGVWSFNKNEPRIAASGMRGDKTIYLKKYPDLKAAVKDYYKNLGKNWAYVEFRKQRTLTSNPYVLTDHLTSYSEKKGEYTKLLRSMIRYNKFDKYDVKSDIEYTKYVEKKPKIQTIVKSKTLIKDTNETKIQVITDINKTKIIDETVSENKIETKDTNKTNMNKTSQGES